jgi:uridylate kinase
MYKRILLKLSGEFLMGEYDYGVDSKALNRIADEIIGLSEMGVQVVVEVGGGNIYRWKKAQPGIRRNVADSMGMLGSVMNAINIRDAITQKNKEARSLSSIYAPYIVQYYAPAKAIKYMEENKIVIIGGGTGNQFFTTDTGAVTHALQTECEIVLKGTNVDGVYDDDPNKNPNAKKYDKLDFQEAIEKKLAVMDMTAFSLAQENNLPIIVFNVNKKGSIKKAALGEEIGTQVKNEGLDKS